MFLKSIEINGFKSFASKIVFEFPHGITGIVGPNGSGKSNICDAVRWVLGEQSAKQLRGSKMEDVIFSGTENRKPLGFAYVAILFDNRDKKIALDYDEVKVARRVYRSGESEYILNGTACRRRDIVELFYDTGIGKDGYSIIGQGQVEKILSGKIEDSRELFDEAAGIAKYKKNRTVTERSLEQEHQNLERVTDVLSELSKQVGPLKEQSEKAREYLRLRDREKDLDIHLFLCDYDHAGEELEENERKQEIVTGDLEETQAACDVIKEKNARLKTQGETLAGSVEEAEAEKERVLSEKEERDHKNMLLMHQVESNKRMIAQYEETCTRTRREKEEKQQQMREQETLKQEEGARLEELTVQKDQLEAARRVLQEEKERISRTLAKQRDAVYSLLDTQLDAKERLSRYDALEEQLAIRDAEYKSRLITYESDLESCRKEAEEVRETLRETKEKYDAACAERDSARDASEALEKKARDLQVQLERQTRNEWQIRSRYDTLIGIAERYDGYQSSIRHIMERKKTNPGIIGVVADILTMPKEYETAIEIALGGALQNVVTEDDETARQLIAWLKENRYGRATFLPLKNIRKRHAAINPAVFEEEGVIGTADTLVHTDPRYEALVQSLLGRTIVADTVDHALLISKKNNYSLRIVTVGGELLNPGGSITGGAYRHTGHLLSRNRELEECKRSLAEGAAAAETLKKELDRLGEKAAAQRKDEKKRQDAAEELELTLHDLTKRLPELEEREKTITASAEALKKEHAALEQQKIDIRDEKALLLRSQSESDADQEKSSSVIERLEEDLAGTEQQLQEKEAKVQEAALAVSRSRQQITFYEDTCRRLLSETETCDNTIEKLSKQKAQLERQNSEAERERQVLLSEIADLSKELTAVSEQLAGLKAEQKEVLEKQNVIFKDLEEQNERLRLLEKEKAALTSRWEKLTADQENRIDYMWDNYELTPGRIRELKRYDIKPSALAKTRREKKDLARQIKALGSVNVQAIEEYKDVGERYDFLQKQYDDIQAAEAHLTGIIEELNTAMKKQFTDRFAEIRKMFTKVFQDLFEGGTADLELMDAENMLECGIRIVAQPPGKKLQNILLLSGGERALTAIALLFAIQRLKPSPFCLLDEIEAALDDANIVRFSNYLKRLSGETQFIVITHRRGTMTVAEVLYGITMQEKGISTLISVDMIDQQLES